MSAINTIKKRLHEIENGPQAVNKERLASELILLCKDLLNLSIGRPDLTGPINMILFCPSCGCQHVDEPDTTIKWTNPPHRSHFCHDCGHIWRPSDVPTNGVRTITTRGQSDSFAQLPHRTGVMDVDTLSQFVTKFYDAGFKQEAAEALRTIIKNWPDIQIKVGI